MPSDERIELVHGISDALKRFRGRGIDVEAMLTREDYARDILQQCRVSGDAELKVLATRFSEAPLPAAAAKKRAQAGCATASVAAPESSGTAHRNRSWVAPLDVFSRRGGMSRS